ncbi:MAG: hypothetical protein EPN97_03425 [Alphaproteobacteria bacterium]|nr:MAG: hypothetical protein EPN97_03425 [Alphaproteobacteria bacterium]
MKVKIFKDRKSRLRAMTGVLLLQLFLLRSCSVKDDFLLPFDPDVFQEENTLKSLLLLLLLVVAAVGFIFLFVLLAGAGAKTSIIMLAALAAGGLLADLTVQQKLAPKPAASKAAPYDEWLQNCDMSCFDGGGMPAAAPVAPPAVPPAPGGAAGA